MKRLAQAWAVLVVGAFAVGLGAAAPGATAREAKPVEAPAAAPDAILAVTHAARGVAGAVEVRYTGGRLRAKPLRDATASMLVRVTSMGDDTFRVEFIGLVSGAYDVATLIELDDGRPATGLGPIPVRVGTQLPPGHGTDVFGLGAPGLGLSAHYRLFLVLGIALWLSVPIVAITRHVLRRAPVIEATPPVPEATPVQRLIEMVQWARSRDLTLAEQGRLELLLLRVLREQGAAAGSGVCESPDKLARAVADLRRDPRTATLVTSVEAWLHSAGGDRATTSAAALSALDAYRPAALAETSATAGGADAIGGAR